MKTEANRNSAQKDGTLMEFDSARPRTQRLWGSLEPGELRPVLLLSLNVFILFTAYYVLKPIREGLILALPGGAELKSGVGALQALFFILLAPLYRVFATRCSGPRLLIGVYLFMALNLAVLGILGGFRFQYLGVVFYFWVGVFNMLTVSQTYSLCADLFTPQEGKRAFPVIVLGAAVGALAGSYVVKALVSQLGLIYPMAISAGLLCCCALLVYFGISKYFIARNKQSPVSENGDAWMRVLGGVKAVFRKRYIALIAGMIFISNLINTNSEYMLGRMVADHFRSTLGAAVTEAALRSAIGEFYATFSLWVNLIVFVLQLLVVSRFVRAIGVFRAMWAVPLLALVSYGVAAVFPLLAVIRVVKIAENATDYSLNNTAKEILYLPLNTEEKYEAKLATDTVFRRLGDAASRPLVFLLMEFLGVGIAGFAGVNFALVLVWLGFVFLLGREQSGKKPWFAEVNMLKFFRGFRWQTTCTSTKIR